MNFMDIQYSKCLWKNFILVFTEKKYPRKFIYIKSWKNGWIWKLCR